MATLVAMALVGCSATVTDDAEPYRNVGSDENAFSAGSDSSTKNAPEAEPTPTTNFVEPSHAAKRFIIWLDKVRAEHPNVQNLYHAYLDTESGEASFVSTAVSAQVLRFFLKFGDIDRAIEIGTALIKWQHAGDGPVGERLAGAFPSQLAAGDSGYAPAYLYDSSDTLTVIEALLDLHRVTDDAAYLRAAERAGAWLRDVMAHGERYGVWRVEHAGIMKAVTLSGDFDNRIAVGRLVFWLPTLLKLSRQSGDASYAQLAKRTTAFTSMGQTSSGGYNDHYDPGFPPESFSLDRFRAVTGDGVVYADDSIRAALGAQAAGNEEAARRFEGYIEPVEGRVVGYLSLGQAKPHFENDTPYYDIVSSSLYAHLAHRLQNGLAGSPTAGSHAADSHAAAATAFVNSTQAVNGGWYWGWNAFEDEPITLVQATMTGLWALADLSPSE